MLQVREVAGKGRGVFASRDISGGEVVLQEAPLLLYPQQGTAAAFCSHCLRAFNSLGENALSVVPCTSCGRVGFCSAACAAAAAADPASHCPAVCRVLAACNLAGLTDEQQSAMQFLARCCSLRAAAAAGDAAAAARFAAVTSLAAPQPLPDCAADAGGLAALSSASVAVRELHGRLSHALAAAGAGPSAAVTVEEAAELLRKDASNGYGIMAPSAPDGERCIRGTGLYAHASLINHECLPNVARFDSFDRCCTGDSSAAAAAQQGANVVVQLRALHNIPAGEEITQSYFPLPWHLSERQQRCREEYGFECGCPRCKEEATWSDEESEWEGDEDAGMAEAAPGDGAATAHDGGACSHAHAHDGSCSHAHAHDRHDQHEQQAQQAQQQAAAGEPRADPAYINLFLMKYVCPRDGCFGTLAPLDPAVAAAAAPSGGGEVCECNMCGGRRTEAEFLAELEGDS